MADLAPRQGLDLTAAIRHATMICAGLPGFPPHPRACAAAHGAQGGAPAGAIQQDLFPPAGAFNLDDSIAAQRRLRRGLWNHPKTAPFDFVIECEAHDSHGPYQLPMPCIRTEAGWINAVTRTALHVTVTGWRYA